MLFPGGYFKIILNNIVILPGMGFGEFTSLRCSRFVVSSRIKNSEGEVSHNGSLLHLYGCQDCCSLLRLMATGG